MWAPHRLTMARTGTGAYAMVAHQSMPPQSCPTTTPLENPKTLDQPGDIECGGQRVVTARSLVARTVASQVHRAPR
jgi:hypothetical protein